MASVLARHGPPFSTWSAPHFEHNTGQRRHLRHLAREVGFMALLAVRHVDRFPTCAGGSETEKVDEEAFCSSSFNMEGSSFDAT